MKSIPVTQTSLPDFDEYINEIKDLWESKWLTNMGVKHQELEQKLTSYLDTNYISLFNNGHLALENIIAALDLTGEVITTPFTFISTTNAIVRNGLVPIFCDINKDDYTIDTQKIESLINERTSAIIPVHVYGNICNVHEIEKIAKKYDLKVIYDAAHAFGVKLNNIGIGNFGDASMFSFHSTKVFNTIEGGAVTFNDSKLENKLSIQKNFGIESQESVTYIGGNAKMNEFQAAMGLCNLRYVDNEIHKRKNIVNRYNENLKDISSVVLVKSQKNVQANYSYFPILFENGIDIRDKVFEELKFNNIFARKYFYPLTKDMECYKSEFSNVDTPIAEYVSSRILTLPLFPNLTLDEVDKICNIVVNEVKKV